MALFVVGLQYCRELAIQRNVGRGVGRVQDDPQRVVPPPYGALNKFDNELTERTPFISLSTENFYVFIGYFYNMCN